MEEKKNIALVSVPSSSHSAKEQKVRWLLIFSHAKGSCESGVV